MPGEGGLHAGRPHRWDNTSIPLSVRADGFAGSKKGDGKHGKRKRGRPRKLSKENRDCLEGRKSKHCT